MSGGTCEATAYQLYGYRTAALCVALGNYHNCGPDLTIAPEFVDRRRRGRHGPAHDPRRHRRERRRSARRTARKIGERNGEIPALLLSDRRSPDLAKRRFWRRFASSVPGSPRCFSSPSTPSPSRRRGRSPTTRRPTPAARGSANVSTALDKARLLVAGPDRPAHGEYLDARAITACRMKPRAFHRRSGSGSRRGDPGRTRAALRPHVSRLRREQGHAAPRRRRVSRHRLRNVDGRFLRRRRLRGRTTTIGWREAEDIAAAVHATQKPRRGPLVLYGPSMAASAILCAQHRGLVAPDAIILECPFDRLSTTTLGNRLKLVGFPEYPLAPASPFGSGAERLQRPRAQSRWNTRAASVPRPLMQGENDKSSGNAPRSPWRRRFGDRATFNSCPIAATPISVRDGGRPGVRSCGSSSRRR